MIKFERLDLSLNREPRTRGVTGTEEKIYLACHYENLNFQFDTFLLKLRRQLVGGPYLYFMDVTFNSMPAAINQGPEKLTIDLLVSGNIIRASPGYEKTQDYFEEMLTGIEQELGLEGRQSCERIRWPLTD